jgi:VanZ family protein
VAGGALAASLFALEMVQRYLPGRTPEITDSLIAVAMTVALWALADRRPRPAVE